MSSKLPKEILRTFLLLLVTILLFSAPVYGAAIKTGQKLIILDPGHGEKERGLTTPMGSQEHQITAELAELITGQLNDSFRVLSTRRPDKTGPQSSIPPEERAAFANKSRADLFVSLHLHQRNHKEAYIFFHESPPASAQENLQAQNPATAPLSKKMAALAAGHLQEMPEVRTLVRPAPLVSLEDLLMPGILVEPFSISLVPAAPPDRADFLAQYAGAIAEAVREYFAGL